MSNSPNQFSPFEFQPEKKFPLEPQPTNGMGVAGFVTSIAGIATCGLLAIFGVILSGIGLRKEPKGFAIAGLVLGLVGLLELVAAVGLVILVTRAVDGVKTIAGQAMAQVEMFQIAVEIGQQWKSTNRLPTQTEGDLLVKKQSGISTTPIHYETDGTTFSLRNYGLDGQANTPDDNTLGPYSLAEAIALVEQFDQASKNEGWEDESPEENMTDSENE